MKTAVVYYSMSGNVESVAESLKNSLDCDLIKLEPQKAYHTKGFAKYFWGGKSAVMGEKPKLLPYSFEAEKYDSIIFGFPVWAGKFTPPLRTFIEENNDSLKAKIISSYACYSGSGADKALEKIRQELGIESFKARMTLIDPLDKPSEENENKIRAFIAEIKK